ncbi:MAG: hypothetical protein LBE91_19155 [Tannerella sp.]|nr:hypothetical protein [Tannerella sp.]
MDDYIFYEFYQWDSNNWIEQYKSAAGPDILWFSIDDGNYNLHMPQIGYDFNNNTYYIINLWYDIEGNYTIHPVNVTYNADGQVKVINILFEDSHPNKGQIWLSYHFFYNERGQLISRIDYNHSYSEDDKRDRQYDYFYNENGDMTLFEDCRWLDGEKKIYDYNIRQIAKYDSQGRKIREERYAGNTNLQRYLLNEYDIYYYSDETIMPNVEVTNNNSIGNENQGNFDLEVNIPTDSISNGSLTITFPEGFTLDEENTNLTLDFASLFDLTITKQENNSWLLEIKPKTTRSASPRAGETTNMLQVAYSVDEKIKRGTYNISVNSILFETPGGNYIPEPAITVPAAVERWGMGNEPVNTPAPVVYTDNQTIYIQAVNPEQIAIYSMTGQKLHETTVQPSLNTIHAADFPQGVLIV